MVAYQLATPIGKVTRLVATILEAFPSVFPEDETLRIRRMSWNHEDFAASPVNMVLAVVTGVGAWLLRKRPRLRHVWLYTAAVAVAYLLLPIVIGHVTSVWGIRYQLPFFVLWAPIAACVVVAVASDRVAVPAAIVFILLSLPYVLFNNIRPLIGDMPYTTRIESILTTDRTEVLLDNSLQRVQNDYAECGGGGVRPGLHYGRADRHGRKPAGVPLLVDPGCTAERDPDRIAKPQPVHRAVCRPVLRAVPDHLCRVRPPVRPHRSTPWCGCHGPFSVWRHE